MPGPGGPTPGSGGQWGGPPREAGFFQSLFDFSFRRSITVSFARVLFVIAIVIACLWYLIALIGAFSGGFFALSMGLDTGGVGMGIFVLLFGWIPPFLWLLVVRVVLEFVVATIRNAQNTSILAERE